MIFLCATLFGLSASVADGQSYLLRMDAGFQSVAFRGVALDSIRASEAVVGVGGGPATTDGFAVTCTPASSFCFFYRPGDRLASRPP